MIEINAKDRDKLVNAMEYLLNNSDRTTVAKMMKECGLNFEEYRLVCDLCMPAIRQQNAYRAAKQSLNYYKGEFNKEVNRLNKRAERLLGLR